MKYCYQQLAKTDVDLFIELLKVFGQAFCEVETYQNAVPTHVYLRQLLGKPHVIVLVALHGKSVVGGLVAYMLDKFEQDRREIYIYDLAVAASHRRRGIATRLINELKKVARQKKAYVIFVQADRGDMAAMRLYASLGVREDVHHFDIPVTELPTGVAKKRNNLIS